MKCPYCDSEFEVEALRHYDEELKNDRPDSMGWDEEGKPWKEGESEGLRIFVCESCAGEIIAEATTPRPP